MRVMYDHGRYQCLLLEVEDLQDSVGADIALRAHILDFPYQITETTRKSMMEVVRGKLDNPDMAHFVLWDRDSQTAVGRAQIENLLLQDGDQPEISQSYIAMDQRGNRLIDWLYQGRLQFLSENGYEHVKAKIERINSASLKAAARNGFSIYQPEGHAGPSAAFHVTRRVPSSEELSVKPGLEEFDQEALS